MIYVEVHAPKAALTGEQRRELGDGIVAAMTGDGDAEGVLPEVLDRARSLMHVVFHEHDDWFAGGRRLGDGDARFLIRVTVPGSWLEEGMGKHVIEECTRVLAGIVGDGVYERPDLLVHVAGVQDGACGVFGRVMTSNDVTRYLTEPNRDAPVPGDLDPGTGYDPVCGMRVPFQYAAATAEHDGTRFAFCSKGCHDIFVEDHVA